MAKELNIDRYIVAGELPWVIIIKPIIRNFDLVPINNLAEY